MGAFGKHSPNDASDDSFDASTFDDLLLAYLYDALDDADRAAVEDRLRESPEAREMLDRAKIAAALLAAAAKRPSADIPLPIPPLPANFASTSVSGSTAPEPALSVHPPRPHHSEAITVSDSSSAPRPADPAAPSILARHWRSFAVAAALIVAAVGIFSYDFFTRRAIQTGIIAIDVQAPTTFHDGAASPVLVKTTTADGLPISATVTCQVYNFPARRGSAPLAEMTITTDADGKGTIPLPTSPAPGGRVQIAVTAEQKFGNQTPAVMVLARDPSALLAYVSTDKPLYRPGEMLRVRVALVERFSLRPAGSLAVRIAVKDPRGSEIISDHVGTENGVAWLQSPLTVDSGGDFTVEVSDPNGENAFPTTKRQIQVRAYRVPKFNSEFELDKDSYGAGDTGKADLSVKRIDGTIPSDAMLTVSVTVDGTTVRRWNATLPASGAISLPFELPASIERGQGQIAVIVNDGADTETVAKTIPIALDKIDVEFFAEGGDLVGGLPTRVYFTAKNPVGEPMDMAGAIEDSAGRVVVPNVAVDALGMGRFELTPAFGTVYRLRVTKPTSITGTMALPPVVRTGATVRSKTDVVPGGQPLNLRVQSTYRGEHQIHAYLRNVLVAQQTVTISADGTADVTLVPTTDMGGVFRVTVFAPLDAGQNHLPVAERLIARHPGRSMTVTATTDKKIYGPGDKVTLTIKTIDAQNPGPLGAILGVSVVDSAVFNIAKDEDTAPLPLHFLVGLDVKELEKVQVYLDGTDKAATALDLLLGTQGWRRFAWRDPDAFVAKHPDDSARIISTAIAGTIANPTQSQGTAYLARSNRSQAIAEHERFLVRNLWLGGAVVVVLAAVISLVFVGIALGTNNGRVGRPLAVFATSVAIIVSTVFVAVTPMGERWVGMDGMASRAVDMPAPTVATGMIAFSDAPLSPDPLNPASFGMRADMEMNMLRDADAQSLGAPVPPMAAAPPAEFAALAAGRINEAGKAEEARSRRALADDRMAGPRDEMMDWEDDMVGPRQAPGMWVRQYAGKFVHAYTRAADGQRRNFTDVVFWDALVNTGSTGTATMSFDLSDSLTTWRVVVEGVSVDGRVTHDEHEFSARLPFSIDPKIPIELTTGDRLDLPIAIANDLGKALGVQIGATLSDSLAFVDPASANSTVNIDAFGRQRVFVPIRVVGQSVAKGTIRLVGDAGNVRDRISREFVVVPAGFPITVSDSGTLRDRRAILLTIPDDIDPATISGEIRLFPSPMATLISGLDSMLQEPYGCFEQTTSTNYPNIMVLQYLEANDLASPEIRRRARQLLANGYNRLIGYECKTGGFEWFGQDPGHPALSAFGVMQFIDMATVYDGVDSAVVPRTVDWLLKQRDDRGYFTQNRRALHSWVAKDAEHINTAFIAWAISSAKLSVEWGQTPKLLLEKGRTSEDPYFLALVANFCKNLGETEMFDETVRLLAAMQQDDGHLIGETQSVVCSRGHNLNIETTALAALAFMDHTDCASNADRAIKWLVEQRSYGGRFGATQGTVLALKALVKYATMSRQTAKPGQLSVIRVDDAGAETVTDLRSFEAGERDAIVVTQFTTQLKPGANRLILTLSGDNEMPMSMTINYRSNTPPSDPACAVAIRSELAQTEVAEGETVGLTVEVKNTTADGVPMTVAIVGLPGGLEPRADQLRELREQGAYNFYEIRNRELIFYWTGLEPAETKTVRLDLVAAIPGQFTGPASTAYVYYDDTKKHWIAPLRVTVKRPGQ